MTATITFTIPKSLWLSANDRMHWAPKSKATRDLRETGRRLALHEKLGPFGTTHVAAFIGYPRGGRVDPSNAAPTVKALIDGMTDAGVWEDDDSTHVLGPTYLRDKNTGQPGIHTVRFVITPQEVPF